MGIRSGELRNRIRIEQRSTAQDDHGEPLVAWDLFAEVSAGLERTPGTEVWAAAQRQARVPVVFRMRYLAGVVPSMRVVFDGRVHDVKSVVDPSGRRAELLLVTEEIVEVEP